MKKPFQHIVFIGRFQPFHTSHLKICQRAFELTDHLIILVGSIQAAPDIRNPWSYGERQHMISRTLDAAGYAGKYTILGIRDYYYSDYKWLAQVHQVVRSCTTPGDEIGFIGFKKDETSYYMDLFPKWKTIEVQQSSILNATDIRNDLFGKVNPTTPLLTEVGNFLESYKKTNEYTRLVEEWNWVTNYKAKYERAKKECGIFDVIHLTTDAVIFCQDSILLVTRGGNPGKGLLALPGGFVNKGETLVNSCYRELKEETRIKLPPELLYSLIDKAERKEFDHPLRSVRGRTVTQAFKIQLHEALPKVKGGDDAKKAKWYPLEWVLDNPRLLNEDHYQIIECLM